MNHLSLINMIDIQEVTCQSTLIDNIWLATGSDMSIIDWQLHVYI